ncbi:MAG: permease [Candidatus Terraquivivens tikiterensis]|uniref:Probable membrane transporter protein n=1 Tax=Candidatus Terraquivivens tikiterensis TaxID=1980982 RepID=A0A2R7Y1S3_9ARCH|nr:MAG: permease [Candidatus Terraquivivens tikiterensis]
MEIVLIIVLVIFGLIAGILGGFLGTGGCVVMLPALYFLFNYSLPVAIGTTITAVIITATSGSIAHLKIRNVDYKTSMIVASSGAVGALLGSIAFQYLTEQLPLLKVILGVAFLYVSIRMIYEGSIRRKLEAKAGNTVPGGALAKSSIGFVIGVLTGIVGLGGGYALVPSMIYLLGAPVKIAVGTSLASFISMAVVSGAFKIYQGLVDVLAALSLGAGTAVGAQIGSRLVPKVPASYIKLVFGIVFLYVSLKFILDVFGIRI